MPHSIKKSKLLLINELIADPDRKSILNIMSDMLSLTLYHKSFPRYYFSRYLFKKGRTNIKDYFSNEFLYYKFKPRFNDNTASDIVENKLFFDFYFIFFSFCFRSLLKYLDAFNHFFQALCRDLLQAILALIQLGNSKTSSLPAS